MLELLDYSGRKVHAGAVRVMDQVGLTHISFSVSDLGGVLETVAEFGGAVVDGTVRRNRQWFETRMGSRWNGCLMGGFRLYRVVLRVDSWFGAVGQMRVPTGKPCHARGLI
jgi:hypothetical protein